jgi:MinD superfamily P-loop ATPase
MHEILIISGKGGTGKTSITAAFSHIASPHVLCDLDVDAPDLHLLLQPNHLKINDFWSGHVASIDADTCTQCGQCVDMCRFDAIRIKDGQPVINDFKCEGCKVCVTLCPEQAIAFEPKHCGTWYISDTRFGPMVHAQLFPAEENSGRLVALIRRQARELAKEKGLDLIIADGPPGIGCPVISALSGTDLAVLVTEPTPSGRHDLERVIGLCEHFDIGMAVLINKWDLHPQLCANIRALCEKKQIPVLAQIAHDQAFTQAMVQQQTITEFSTDGVSTQIRAAWKDITNLIPKNKTTKETL